jgi:hypothetical protein
MKPRALTVDAPVASWVKPALLIAGVATAHALMAEHVRLAAVAGVVGGGLSSRTTLWSQ